MNKEAQLRHSSAQDITDKIKDLSEAVIEVGSVSYAPDNVRKDSDLDLVVVLDFHNVDFKELYKRISQPYELSVEEYAKEGRINTFSIIWNNLFEIGMHVWDTSAFETVVTLSEKPNTIFYRGHVTGHQIDSDRRTLHNLRGEPKQFLRSIEHVPGGKIIGLCPAYEDETGFYPGIQLNNLVLNPTLLHQKNTRFTEGVIKLDEILKSKISNYRKTQTGIAYCNALDPELRAKIPERLQKVLNEFY